MHYRKQHMHSRVYIFAINGKRKEKKSKKSVSNWQVHIQPTGKQQLFMNIEHSASAIDLSEVKWNLCKQQQQKHQQQKNREEMNALTHNNDSIRSLLKLLPLNISIIEMCTNSIEQCYGQKNWTSELMPNNIMIECVQVKQHVLAGGTGHKWFSLAFQSPRYKTHHKLHMISREIWN